MRTSIDITEQEISAIVLYATQNSLETDGPDGDKNANEIVDYYTNVWNEDINQTTLPLAVEQLRKAGRLVFKSAAKAKFDQAIKGMTHQQYETFRAWLRGQRLVTTGDEGYENAENIISWVREKNLPMEDHSFSSALSNITSNGHFGHAQIHWNKKLQDSEAEAQRQKDEAAKPARDEHTELVGENTLAPHLREHRRQMHAALAEAEARKIKETHPSVDQEAWKARAESLVADTNLDQAEVKRMFVMEEHDRTQINWPATHRARINYIEKRRNQRSLVGR